MRQFIDIGALDDIPPQGARVVRTPAGCIALFRTAEDRIFALEDRCPHRGGPLSEGIVHGEAVTCPLHNWVFDLNTGAVTGGAGAEPGTGVATFAVRVEAGRILLDPGQLAQRVAA